MAFKITIPYYAIALRFSDESEVYVPFNDHQVLRLDVLPNALAEQFRGAFQKNVLDKGAYFDILNEVNEAEYATAITTLKFPNSKDKISYPKFEIDFEYIYQPTEKGYWAIIPALGLESFAEEEETLKSNVEQAIKLEFARKKRLNTVQRIVTTLWYDAISLHETPISFSFYTPTELENLNEERKEQLLPKVAQQLDIRKQVVFGREAEMDLILRAMKAQFGRNILLVGASGVGKTALVWELVRRRKQYQIKADIYETTASTLIKELTRDTGWQDNMAYLCRELSKKGDILFIRNFLELFEVGQYEGNSVSMAEYMRSYISRGEISIISECTDEEFARIEARSPNYLSHFQVIRLEEPKKGLEEIISKKVRQIAKTFKIAIQEEAIKETVRLNRRYTPYSGFPGKPIRFLESLILYQSKKETLGKKLNRSTVIQHFCEETGMPPFMVDPEIPMDIREIYDYFKGNIFGQNKAVTSVTDLLASVKTALTRQGKPIASLLFVGPTGVGKTEMGKVLANFMFGSRRRMIRFDMSEYSTPYAVMRLTGESYFKDGLLTSAVRREPFCVLLFDEIEKAHPVFYDLLLQMLGEGRLTDSSGKLVNFCSTIIIMTSNIGAANLQNNKVGWRNEVNTTMVTEHFMSAVRKHFRPELFNRIDQVIPFEPLDKEVIRLIVNKEIGLLRKLEGIQYRKMDFYLQDAVLDYLGSVGYDPKYGARKLQRTIREELSIPLANELNQYANDDQLIVNINLEHQKPAIHIEADPLKLDLLLEELTRNEYADHASSLRRSIHRLQEGRFHVRLLNELDMMERQKRKVGDQKFFGKQKRGEKYTYYLTTKENVQTMVNIIEGYEDELAMIMMDLRTYKTQIIEDIKDWEKEYFDLKVELYTRLSPQVSVTYLSIYGKQLHFVLDVYQQLCAAKNFEIEYTTLWYREKYYNEEIIIEEKVEDGETGDVNVIEKKETRKEYIKETFHGDLKELYKPPKKGDILVGIDLKISGTCANMYFQPEYGFMQWQQEKEVCSYLVVSDGKAIIAPSSLYRKSFFDKRKARRTYSAELLEDKEFKLKKVMDKTPFAVVLQEELDKLFEAKLDAALM